MKGTFTALCLLLLLRSGFSQNIAIQELLYNQSQGNDKFELINTSSMIINVAGWWLCARFSYLQLGSPTDIEVLQGNLNMPAGSTLKLRIISLDLNDTHSDFGIYTNTNFASTVSMQDFIQYGSNVDVGRGTVAVAKGIWRDMDPGASFELDFIPTATDGNSTNWDGDNGGGNDTTYSTDFMNDLPTLPVHLLTLSGRVNIDKKVELNWIALDEYATEKHVIEKSLDGQVYDNIGEVPAQNLGAEAAQYSFLDENPTKNMLHYYRIRQIDNDGHEAISTTLYLKVKDVVDKKIFLAPMPISGTGCFSMEFYWPKEEELANFRIVDMSGKEVARFAEPVREGYNFLTHQFYGIEPGEYIMVLSDEHGDYRAEKFLIGR